MVPITPELLESYLENELDPQTTEYVERWLLENKIERDMLHDMLHPSEGVRMMASLDPEHEWFRMKRSMGAQKTATLPLILKVAATLVFAILAGYFWLQHDGDQLFERDPLSKKDPLFMIANNELRTKVVSLEDGSQVYLNRGATVTFSKAFKTNRHIQLSGEAFFDVAVDPQHPFLIETGDCQVEVKGTSFNIYSDSLGVEVAVSSGVVQFSTPDEQPVTLEKDQMANYESKGRTLTTFSTSHSNVFSWRTQVLVFQQTLLDEVIHDLSRYFNRNIRIQHKPNIPLPEFTSQFTDPSLSEVLEEMKSVLQVTYTMDGNDVLITVK